MRAGAIIGLAAAGLAAAAAAQTLDGAPMLKCAVVVDDAARLACYDAAMVRVSAEARAAEAARRERAAALAKQRAADAERLAVEAERSKRESFGAAGLPAERRRGPADETLDLLEAKVAELLTDSRSNAIFVLDNGQMWRQTESMPLPPVRAGDAVRVKRGALGAFRLTLVRQGRTVPVKRMR